ncbi:MAG: acetyl-CoA carboxylase biotin carboxyl carrier protein subunit [Desulfobacterota bacterium]|nr:acetyl-CoA carboxylase biotin carboxyl carrier protein subunit [Thermodesulfobacteriota bacterium]
MDYRLKIGERAVSFHAERKGAHGMTLSREGSLLDVDYTIISSHHVHLTVNGSPVNAYIAEDGDTRTVLIRGITYSIEHADAFDNRGRGKKRSQAVQQDITAPMPSVVIRILVSEGDAVSQGDNVIVVSAMKMETTLTAPFDGSVRAVNVAVGDKVMPGRILIDIDRTVEQAIEDESHSG